MSEGTTPRGKKVTTERWEALRREYRLRAASRRPISASPSSDPRNPWSTGAASTPDN